jgi:opacity protein-like surface antigen
MKRIALFAAIAALCAPSALLADMNYTSFEVDYLDLDGDGGVNGDGFEIGGSWELNDQFHLFGSWQDQSFDGGYDGETLELGGGWSHSFSDTLDFVGRLSLIDAEIEDFSDDGLALGGGIRSRLGESFELDAGLKYVDLDESGSDTGLTVGGRYYLNDSMALGASLDSYDNADTLRLGFRWEF